MEPWRSTPKADALPRAPSPNKVAHLPALQDIRVFMALFLMFLGMFYTSMFIVYPAPNPMAAQFNDPKTAFSALIDLAFLGEGVAAR